MRRSTAIISATFLALATSLGTSATADGGHEKPKITVMTWIDPPLKAGSEELLKITAHDPDSSISEIQVKWGDQGMTFAHSHCVQGTEPGTPHTMKLGWIFAEPGQYEVEAVAYSEKRCVGGADTRHSKVQSVDAHVVSAMKMRSDPDDLPAPLDISTIAHSQSTDEASLKPILIHSLRTFEPWETSLLQDASTYISFSFDIDEDDAIEREIVVDVDQAGNLRGEMRDMDTGQRLGSVSVSRADEHSLEVSFAGSMMKRRLRSYRWKALTTYYEADHPNCGNSASICADFAPDEKLMLHHL